MRPPSRSALTLARRIVAILDMGPRTVQFFRSFAASDAIFEQAIGKLFLKGLVLFAGKTRGRVLRLNGRRAG